VRLRIASDTMELKPGASLTVWYRAIRLHYVPPSFLPAIIGAFVAWTQHYRPDIPAFLLVLIGVTVNHFGLNMLDDACDFLHNIDCTLPGQKNPYTGGSGVLTEGLLSPRQLVSAAVFCFAITCGIGLYLTIVHGWPVLAFGVFGIFCSVFYTLPPIKFGYRGMGEFGLLINFGPVIGLGAYYVQAHSLALEPFLVSLVLGVMMWSEIVINEIPDFKDDRRGGKRNLVVRAGRKAAVFLYSAGLLVAYGILLYAILRGFAPLATVAGFVSLPYALRSIVVLRTEYLNSVRMLPANLAMIKTHLLTGLGIIAGYAIYFWQHAA
jgi:1,4-dihydroxy-2-naphthoate polyprenyltransferase